MYERRGQKCPLYFYEMKRLLHGNTCVEMKSSSAKQSEKVQNGLVYLKAKGRLMLILCDQILCSFG